MKAANAVKGQEVSVRALCMVAEVLERRGLHDASLYAGLSFSPVTMQNPFCRVDWDDFTVWCDRIAELAGGREGMDALLDDILGNSRFLGIAANQFISVRHLYVYGMIRVARAMYNHLGIGAAVLPDGRVRLEQNTPRTHRGSLVIAYNNVTAFRLYPRLMGLPPATVSAEITAHHQVYLITPPEEGTRTTRLKRLLGSRLNDLLHGEARAAIRRPLSNDLDLPLIEGALMEGIAPVGRRLVEQSDLDALWREFACVARDRLCAHRVALWVRRRDDVPFELVGETGSAGELPVCLRPLVCAGREVGRIEIDSCTVLDVPSELDALLPWLALAAERCILKVAPSRARVDVAETARQRGLTPRQEQVLALLVEGASNKDVASALGNSVHTVELHVSELLRKSRCPSRGALIARAWNWPVPTPKAP
jgi:DNA-binding CsgD family transcriptional regulator